LRDWHSFCFVIETNTGLDAERHQAKRVHRSKKHLRGVKIMGMLLIGFATVAAMGVVGFGIAALVDTQRRKQEHLDFLTGTIRQAVFHTASLPVGHRKQRGLRVQTLPLLAHSNRQLIEDSGFYPVG